MNIHQWKKQLRRFNKFSDLDERLKKEWNDNTLSNMHRFNKKSSIWATDYRYHGDNEKAAILVGASPCLEKDVLKLKERDENFVIICANSALRFLLKHDIRPEYCICLDSDHLDIPQHLDCDSTGITLLASSAVCEKALNDWKGPIYYMAYYSIDPKIRGKLRYRLGKRMMCGGNSISQALYVSTILWDCHTVIFVGNEFCFDINYYADKDAAKQEKIDTVVSVVDSMGRQRWTLGALYMYSTWIDRFCSQLTPPGIFIDTSFGLIGKDSPGIYKMDLSQALSIVKESFRMKKELNSRGIVQHEQLSELFPVKENVHDKSEVLRYNVHQQQAELLRVARGRV